MSTRARWGIGSAFVVLAALVLTIAVALSAGPPAPGSGYAGTASARPDTAWKDLFQAYGNLSGAWSGGDGAQALLMPDGSTIWFFADTFLGATGPGGTRPPLSTGLAHNRWRCWRAAPPRIPPPRCGLGRPTTRGSRRSSRPRGSMNGSTRAASRRSRP